MEEEEEDDNIWIAERRRLINKSNMSRTDSEAEGNGTVYKNSYASLINDLPPSTSLDEFKQSVSNFADLIRPSET
ncbi:unnamed protein product [Caenorhabditis angaria]|uniref:Uncharacterized protein n=1 Tax=Caenorhabditis angaria TaxID=860376 RepID=A0A9P1NAW0_9PELO|nr:unnamed protein product [Caenorhabditis angaria]